MTDSVVWFTHSEHRLETVDFHVPTWTDELKNWNCRNCIVSAQKKCNNVEVIVRRKKTIHSGLTKKDHQVRFIYNFDIADVPKPESGMYAEPSGREDGSAQGPFKKRWFLPLVRTDESNESKKNCWLWQWSNENGKQIIHDIYEQLQNVKSEPNPESGIIEKNINRIPNVPDGIVSKVLPIIYQPAIDTMKNFLRQIHIYRCSDNLDKYEITLVFNNEQLRQHKLFNPIYEYVRLGLYGRTQDVETFHIILDDTGPRFVFENIYSKEKNIVHDDVHYDKKFWFFGKVKKRPVSFYYDSTRYPKVFINTSNHAMAGHDNNDRLWKWEYVYWDPESPVILGCLSRERVEEEMKKFSDLWNTKNRDYA